jgi:Mannosylglycerate hydrolase MGH1-like glycoside hydrolase domain
MSNLAKRKPLSAEHARLEDSSPNTPGNWKVIGPYVSERAWGTVREDYSADGQAWQYFPYEHARSRAYRWNEDGLAGLCDRAQRLCFALAFWNGRDPFLKERIFGLSGPEGNHGEDAKEYWWYIDATPTSSWLRWRYHYPHAEFPYALLRQENARRNKDEPEFELVDTGVFEGDRYWQITADYAKASPDDVCMRISVRNAGPDPAELHVLPTLWFRNRWSWEAGVARPIIRAAAETGNVGAIAEEELLGRWRFTAGADPAGKPPPLLFCENETNARYLYGVTAEQTSYPKDGINDHVVHKAATVNPARQGTKMACWYRLKVAAGETVELRLRLRRDGLGPTANLGADFERIHADRSREADEYYTALTPDSASDDEAAVMRQAFAGMLWSQQFYHYDVARWLDGDIIRPPEARTSGRNADWRHLNNHDIIAMPDKWEYPWYASWDLAFHCVVLAHIDPSAAKHQLLLLAREWYTHPNGQLPAYEWNFGDVNPPVQAWATLAVFRIDGGTDFDFLARAFQKLLINFTWWVNREDACGDNVFEGGFLGLDNIGPFDRSQMLPDGDVLEQSDGTAWMAKFCLNMLEMALRLANHQPSYEDLAVKFFEHFALIAAAMNKLWDDQDGFFYDRLRKRDGSTFTVRARSMVGLLPIFAAVQLDAALWERLPMFRERALWYIENKPGLAEFLHMPPTNELPRLISLVGKSRMKQILACMLDESEFLSCYGLRSLSRYHREHPLILNMDGHVARLDYEPGESRTGLFGGNSNWRGPIWFPLNFLAIESLRHLHTNFGEGFTVELPTGSGKQASLEQVADELERRLLGLFLRNAEGQRPALGLNPRFQRGGAWCDLLIFYEYFHGDTGKGLGASHQTGWTALAGALVANRRLRNDRDSCRWRNISIG